MGVVGLLLLPKANFSKKKSSVYRVKFILPLKTNYINEVKLNKLFYR